MSNAHKDLTYYTQMADDTADCQQMAAAVKQLFKQCLEVKPDAVLTEIIPLMAEQGNQL